ncbi:TRAP transporter small permease [Marinovum sp. 2_MG-2023]|uniref:TRAP transporter small permease subunit n=1 Tax=unclassified Marinovum TaxID=2647166 RepID=UPI0026E49247|nr:MULTISPECIES: TRAP transporter small permease [unclassified Marinovum]MDO6730872.1 TRAP transporter small permease [Marinovum sp. 2_MG-2023]MDO6780099.1 TRAP transporter small permease [Marinovum sp. 1_MG-2023]
MPLPRWIRIINCAGLYLAQATLLMLMLIISYAVFARYVLQSPSVHAVEISSYLLALLIWSAVGWTHVEGGHVSLEHFTKRRDGVMKVLSVWATEISIMIVCVTLAFAGVKSTLNAIDKDYRSASLLEFPQWPLLLLIPLGATLLCLTSIGRLWVGTTYKHEG